MQRMASSDDKTGDLLVIFGITGDLARKMTVQPYAPGSWGPAAAESLVRGHPRWQEPWLADDA